jgi:hypothetical protein
MPEGDDIYSSQLIVHKTIMEYDVLNASPGLRQTHKCNEVKPVIVITKPFLVFGMRQGV